MKQTAGACHTVFLLISESGDGSEINAQFLNVSKILASFLALTP